MSPKTLEGQTLGKYQILEPLGRGGMAQVYRAYHAQLDRYVAVKVLRSDLVGEQEFLARFSREARAVAALRHPNIVQVYDFDVQDDLYYMVMELMEGDSLKAHMNHYRARGEAMPPGEIAHILTDVLNGLGYAHAEGIIHRDVKPANILLTRRGQAVITDFGIAQIVGGTNYTVSGALMGTLHYMAPEQGLGTDVDGRCDLYSLGVVLYEILTGHPPFDADTPLAILMKHLNDPLPLPRGPEAIPAPFERVVLKALAKKPADRYQTAAEMAQALREAAAACAGSMPAAQTPLLPENPPESGAGAPLDPPQVYSGTARQNLADVNFAADVTDPNLEERLRAQTAVGEGAVQSEPGSGGTAEGEAHVDLSASFDEVVKSASRLFSTVGGVISAALVTAAEEVKQETAVAGAARAAERGGAESISEPILGIAPLEESSSPPIVYPLNQEAALAPRSTTQAALLGAGLLVGYNFLAVGLGISTGWWGLFQYGWASELLLVALLLFLLMGALATLWLLIPAGILMGNGLLFAFSSLTGNWRIWGLAGLFEPLLVGGVIYITLSLNRHAPHAAARLARRVGWPLAVVTGGSVALIGLGSLLASLIHSLFS